MREVGRERGRVGSEEGRVGGSLTAVCLVGVSMEKERDGAMIY